MTKGLQRPTLGVRLSEAGIRSVVCRLRERERASKLLEER